MLFKSRLISILFIILIGVLGGLFGSFFYYSSLVPDVPLEWGATPGARSLFRERFRDSRVYSPSDVARLNVYTAGSIATIYPKRPIDKDILTSSYLPHERLGVGFVITADGWIIVQPNVVRKIAPEKLVVQIGKEFVSAEKIVIDAVRSVAYIKVKTNDLDVLNFADSDDIRFGDQFFIVAGKNKVTSASVSSLSRRDESTRVSLVKQSERLERLVGLEPVLRDEFLGAPVVTIAGEVVGIVTRNDTRGEALILPINNVRRSVRQLLQGQKFSSIFVGVSYLDLNEEHGAQAPYANGFLIYENSSLGIQGVQPDSPAYKAGLRPRDVIRQINDRDVRGPLGIAEILDDFEAGDTANFSIARDNEDALLKVVLGEK